MPEAGDPVFQFVTQTPRVKKLGLLFSNELYEVYFEEDGAPIGGPMALHVLRAKIAQASAMDGIMLILSEGPLRLLLGRDEQGTAIYQPRTHMKGLAVRQKSWFGLAQAELVQAFEVDRRLRIIARPSDCHRIDACVLPRKHDIAAVETRVAL